MKNSYRGGHGDRKTGVKGAFGHRRPGGASEMHDAICSECGSACQVPFKPNGKKPVFCSNCFQRDEAGTPKPFSRPAVGDQRSAGQTHGSAQNLSQIEVRLAAIEEKIDALIDALTSDLDDEDEEDDDEELIEEVSEDQV